jgi:predicted site-specific integrase-resolvase
VQAALGAHGRGFGVVGSSEGDDDLVRDMTEILTRMCARFYGNGAAHTGAKGAVAAVAEAGERGTP